MTRKYFTAAAALAAALSLATTTVQARIPTKTDEAGCTYYGLVAMSVAQAHEDGRSIATGQLDDVRRDPNFDVLERAMSLGYSMPSGGAANVRADFATSVCMSQVLNDTLPPFKHFPMEDKMTYFRQRAK